MTGAVEPAYTHNGEGVVVAVVFLLVDYFSFCICVCMCVRACVCVCVDLSLSVLQQARAHVLAFWFVCMTAGQHTMPSIERTCQSLCRLAFHFMGSRLASSTLRLEVSWQHPVAAGSLLCACCHPMLHSAISPCP